MNPFFPLIGNPFIGIVPSIFVYSLCIYLGLLGIGVCIVRILYNQLNLGQEGIEDDVFST
jgi:hypothetical protein